MKSDITRNTFDPAQHFSRVLMQQGRVQLDADWNEQVSSLLHYLRALAADVIGPAGGPVAACGFSLTVSGANNAKDLIIGPGRYYVNGLLCENDQPLSFFSQVGLGQALSSNALNTRLANGGGVGFYLDVWEQHVTYIEEADIREVALGGPDTATRARIVWLINVLPATQATIDGDAALVTALQQWETAGSYRGTLKARVLPQQTSDDPCEMPAETAYLGAENQLYRVEIHDGGTIGKETQQPTFKWSRDNGSVVAAWLQNDGKTLTVTGVHDQARGFAPGQWVETSDETSDLQGVPGTFVHLTKVDGGTLTYDPPANALPIDPTNATSPTVRRWDQQETDTLSLTNGVIAITEATGDDDDLWITLEDGVQIQFQPPAANTINQYRTGDYWLIPARVATKNVDWPQETVGEVTGPAAVGPRGVTHHYAPLGILATVNGAWSFEDCRCQFAPLGCEYGYYVGGDGIGADLI